MAEHELIWKGRSSTELGVHIISEPPYDIAQPSVTANHILGRNGDILTEVYDFSNSERSYQMTFELHGQPFNQRCGEIMDWLCYDYMHDGSHSYSHLEDSYDPNIYYLATFKPGGEMQKALGSNASLGSYTATFNRRPERFYKSGLIELNGTVPTEYPRPEFFNNTMFASYPYIRLTVPAGVVEGCVEIHHWGSSRYSSYVYRIVVSNSSSSEKELTIDGLNHTVSVSSNALSYRLFARHPVPFDDSNMDHNKFYENAEILFWPGPNTLESVAFREGGTAATGITYSVRPNWWTL